jgi:hypothetical protein
MREEYVYRERQFGWTIMLMLLGAALFVVSVTLWREPLHPPWQPLLLGTVLGLVALAMGSLTVEVGGGELRWRFGWLGWPGGHVALADIARVEPCRTKWHEGWGIRITPNGMLYNISGLDALQVTRRDGKRFRLGSADVAGLMRVLAPRL